MRTGDESATACFIVCSLFVKNAASCEALRLIRLSHLQRWRSVWERFGPRMLMPENLQNEQSSCSFSRDNKQAITSSYYKNTDYWLENQTLMLKSVPQMLKKWRIVVNKISKLRQTTCNRITKILDEATRIVNVFLICWFSFQRNLLGKLLRNRPFFTNRFSAKLATKIPAKFPRNRPFFPRICPWKSREIWPFFSATYQKPWSFRRSV